MLHRSKNEFAALDRVKDWAGWGGGGRKTTTDGEVGDARGGHD